jgi:hypothetical protein
MTEIEQLLAGREATNAELRAAINTLLGTLNLRKRMADVHACATYLSVWRCNLNEKQLGIAKAALKAIKSDLCPNRADLALYALVDIDKAAAATEGEL